MKVSGWPSAAPMGHAEIMGVLKAPEVLTLVRTPDGVWGTPACLYSSQTTAPPPRPPAPALHRLGACEMAVLTVLSLGVQLG